MSKLGYFGQGRDFQLVFSDRSTGTLWKFETVVETQKIFCKQGYHQGGVLVQTAPSNKPEKGNAPGEFGIPPEVICSEPSVHVQHAGLRLLCSKERLSKQRLSKQSLSKQRLSDLSLAHMPKLPSIHAGLSMLRITQLQGGAA